MSRLVLNLILNEMQIFLSEIEREQLYNELLTYFGLIGAPNECEALETAWKDPYNRSEIEKFIMEWLRRKRRKKGEAIAGVA